MRGLASGGTRTVLRLAAVLAITAAVSACDKCGNPLVGKPASCQTPARG